MVIIVLAILMLRRLLGTPSRAIRATARNKTPENGYYLVHLKPNAEFTNKNQKEPYCIDVWAIQSWGEEAAKACTNCQDGEEVFVNCRTYGTLFDGACGNCKKRDHGA
jgi:hypothetical protein